VAAAVFAFAIGASPPTRQLEGALSSTGRSEPVRRGRQDNDDAERRRVLEVWIEFPTVNASSSAWCAGDARDHP
jgi:hypothetical protein